MPIILFIPYIHSGFRYIKSYHNFFKKNGFQFIYYNAHADKSFYNPFRFPDDIHHTILYLTNKYKDNKIFIYAESMGCLSLGRYLGDHPETPVIGCAASCGMGKFDENIKNIPKSYQKYIIKHSPIKTKQKTLYNMVVEQSKLSGIEEFDKLIEKCEPNSVVHNISVPTLVFQADNDKVIDKKTFNDNCYNDVLENKNICVINTKYGGHCGYLDYKFNRWNLDIVVKFFNWILNSKDLTDDNIRQH